MTSLIKKLTVLFFILISFSGYAQKSRAQLYAEITATLPSNGSNQITAALLRMVLSDMVASAGNLIDDKSQFINHVVPASGDTILIIPTKHITTIAFQDSLTSSFVLQIGDTSACHVGDMIFLVTLKTVNDTSTITFLGNIMNMMCGGFEPTWTVNDFLNIIPFIFDGKEFIGIDNC